jgi:hypothetical protein
MYCQVLGETYDGENHTSTGVICKFNIKLGILKTTCIFILLSSKYILNAAPLHHYLKINN